ncbi:MAG: AAA family ATPase [Anaerostipes sp.]|nr:AAA family ATPase [Anaerostipes sp.]
MENETAAEAEIERLEREIELLETEHPELKAVCDNGKARIQKQIEKVDLISFDDVEKENVTWLYHPYIPKGKITICGAYPGVGKTFLLCYMAACVSTGRQFFDIVPFSGEPGKAIYLTTEDGIGDTIKPRLEACGANMKNIATVKSNTSSLTFDNPQIEDIVKEFQPDLFIFDPFQSFIGEDVEMNASNKTRSKLNYIIEIAEKYNVAIVLICHFNKNQKGDAITRVMGSTDIMGVCRSFLALGIVPDNKDLRYMSHEKSSLAKNGKTVLFEIVPDDGGIKFVDYSSYSMDEYAAMAKQNGKRAAPALEEAKAFIIRNMPEGKRLAADMETLAEANGFSKTTIYRARTSLKIKSKQNGFKGKYYWTLPRDTE